MTEPDPLPLTSFCTAGYADPSIADHEATLIRLHRSGMLRLIDRGRLREESSRRWRVSWGQGSDTVRAMLGVVEDAGEDGEAMFWLYAEAKRPFEIRNQANPVERMGLSGAGLKDPSAAYSLTQHNPLVGLTDVGFLEYTFNRAMRESPVLVYHCPPENELGQQMTRFRNATSGMSGLLLVDDEVRSRVNELLPPQRRIPRHAARLYVPPWWVGHIDDIVVDQQRLGRPGEWRKIVETVVRVNSWRAGGRIPVAGQAWRSLLYEPMQDQRVLPETRGGSIRWLPSADDTGKQVLRKRLAEAHERQRQARQEADQALAEVTELNADLRAVQAKIQRAQDSRRRLAELTQRLRRERDAAETAVRASSVAGAWQDAREAELEARLYAEELDRADDELHELRSSSHRPTEQGGQITSATDVSDASSDPPRFTRFAELVDAARSELPRLRFGPQVSAASGLDGHQRSAQWLRKTWDVLVLLDAYALARREAADLSAPALRGFAHYVRECGGVRGVSPTHVASGESEMVANTPRFRAARTFVVPSEVRRSGWEFFGAHVKIDRGGGVAPRLHYLDDTAGPTGAIHIGYIGPHLPSPETN